MGLYIKSSLNNNGDMLMEIYPGSLSEAHSLINLYPLQNLLICYSTKYNSFTLQYMTCEHFQITFALTEGESIFIS